MGKLVLAPYPLMKNAILADWSVRTKLFWTIASVIAPTLLRWLIDRGEHGVPFVTFFPAIMLSSVFLGWRCAIVTAVSAGIIGNRLFRGHPGLLHGDVTDFVMAGLFALSCAIMIWSGEALRRSIRELDISVRTQTILSGELRHRIGNTLQIVQSFAEATARFSPKEQFLPAFSARIAALAIATNRLAGEAVQPCDLRGLILDVIRPFQGTDQFQVDGPECAVPREQCISVTLALHELCTNALKYGALSVPGGGVRIQWSRPDPDHRDRISLIWEEVDGPRVERPARRGMGTILLESQSELEIHSIDFHPEGFRCEMSLKIAS